MKPPTLEPDRIEPSQPHPNLPHATNLPPIDLDAGANATNHWWVWLLVFALIGFGCYRLYQYESGKKQALSAATKGKIGRASCRERV